MISVHDSSAPAAVGWIERHRRWVAPFVFLIATLAAFGSTLWSKTLIFSFVLGDMTAQFAPWRSVGFAELAHGNLMLWNPYVYGGGPYFGGFQSALLYPLNWQYLFLPLIVAINVGMAMHVFLAGQFTYAWARGNGVSAIGSILAGLIFMFSGPFWLRNYAGHLPHTCVMVWTPLLLWCVDGLFRDGRRRWTMIGAACVALQIFAGHPQYVYFTGVGVGLYAIVKSVHSTRVRIAWTQLVILYAVGAALSAVQLGAGLAATSESLRAGGGSDAAHYQFASSFSLAPSDLLSSIAPYFFCTGTTLKPELVDGYWGSKYVWEGSLFVGVIPLMLAAMSLGRADRRRTLPAVVVGVAALVLALGPHTPLYRLLYAAMPGYASFRGTCKFAFLVTLPVALCAGIGLDAMLQRPALRLRLLIVAGIAGVALFALAQAIRVSSNDPTGTFAQLVYGLTKTDYQYNNIFLVSADELIAPQKLLAIGAAGATSLANAGWFMLATAGITGASLRIRGVCVALAGLAAAELLAVAIGGSTSAKLTIPHASVDCIYAINELPADQRVLVAINGSDNLPMAFFKSDIWGYDPMVLRRWAEFVFAMQNLDPSTAIQYCDWLALDQKLLQMIRCRYLFFDRKDNPVVEMRDLLPQASLVGNARVSIDRSTIFSTMRSDEFNPRRQVMLEQSPSVRPGGSDHPGDVHVISSTTDTLEIDADVQSPAVLLVTNAFSRGWKATSIGPSPQNHYDVLPTDWALQGVPLAAGKHHLLLRYRPDGFVIGLWVSVASVIGYAIAVGWFWKRSRLDSNQRPSD